MSVTNEPKDTQDALMLDPEEASSLLGVSKAHFYRMKAQGQIGPKPVKLGKKMAKYNREEFIEWVNSGCPDAQAWGNRKQEGI